MAENPIKKEDIIDAASIVAEIMKVVDALKNQLLPAMDLIVKKATEEKAAIEKLNPVNKEDQVIIAEKASSVKLLDDEQKRNKQTLSEIEKLERQLAKAMSAEGLETARLRTQISDMNKANRDIVASEKVVKGSLTDLEQQLAKLKKAWRDVGSAHGASTKEIEALDKKVKSLSSSIGNNQKNVGGYTKSIKEAAGMLFSFGGVAGIVTGVVGKLKDAFAETETGVRFFKQAGEAVKTYFQSIITGNMDMAGVNALVAIQIAKQQDQLRLRDRQEAVTIAGLETEIKLLRIKASTEKDSAKQLEIYKEADSKENEIIALKTENLNDEINLLKQLTALRPKDSALADELNNKEIELINLKGDKNLKIQSKIASDNEKIRKQEETNLEKKATAEAKEAQEEMDLRQEVEDYKEELLTTYAKKIKESQDKEWESQVKTGQLLFDQNQADAKRQWDLILEQDEKKKKLEEKAAEDAITIEQAKRQAINDITMAALDFASTLLETAKQNELEAAGDNAEAKEKIEKEYAKKEKAMAISKAVISTALSVLNALQTQPYLLGVILAASAAAVGAIQIATIAATKFAEGGEVGGKLHSQGGTLIEAEKDEFIIKRKSASKYKGLLKAINDDDPMRIAEELRNKKFHTVWGGVQETLSNVSRQDPYTRLMYEEIKNKPFSYQDSDGNTVLIQNNIKRVIKKR